MVARLWNEIHWYSAQPSWCSDLPKLLVNLEISKSICYNVEPCTLCKQQIILDHRSHSFHAITILVTEYAGFLVTLLLGFSSLKSVCAPSQGKHQDALFFHLILFRCKYKATYHVMQILEIPSDKEFLVYHDHGIGLSIQWFFESVTFHAHYSRAWSQTVRRYTLDNLLF